MLELRTRASAWDEAVIKTLPLEVGMPFYLIKNVVEFADEASFDDGFSTFGFSFTKPLYHAAKPMLAKDLDEKTREVKMGFSNP